MSDPSGNAICQYYFNDLSLTNVNNYTTGTYDLSLVNVGTASFPTITPVSKSTLLTPSLFQNTSSFTNYSYYVNNTNAQVRSLTGSFSVSWWTYIDSTLGASFGTVWCLYNDLSNNFITFTQQNSVTGAPLILCITLNGVNSYIGSVGYAVNTYHRLVLTCSTSGSTSTIKFYLNGAIYNFNTSNSGALGGSVVYNGTDTITVTGALFNGANTTLYVLGGPSARGITWPANSTSQSHGFNGYIGRLNFYNKALTQSEITFLNTNQSIPPPVLVTPTQLVSVNYTGTYTKIPAVPINSLFYDIYTLTGNGTLTFSFSVSNVQVLIVGGGGGGGGTANTNEGGGGGGGGGVGVGYLTFTGSTNYSISIGNGGVGGAANSSTLLSTSGGNTTISGTAVNETANGGGSGGNSFSQTGGNGGSGGGGNGGGRTYPGGTSTKGTGTLTYYGNAGGGGLWLGSGGGGGGASSAGVDGTKSTGGNAGTGYTWTINGSMYGGGGGGGLAGTSQITLGTGTPGSGSGGGGNGGSSFVPAVAGTANTGGGGGGGYAGTGGASGGVGGSGVVIFAVLVPNPTYPCFKQGTKILRFNPETYQDEYVPVESLRKGDLVATAESGYQPIHSIGYKTITKPKSDPNPSNRLYKFSSPNCKEIFEPLYITGEHCTLHRHIPAKKRNLITEHMGDVYITEEYYRMPAFLDDRGESYDGEDSPATIWHFALEHENVAHNYGVFANGLLVESCAIESLMEKSGMRLLEE